MQQPTTSQQTPKSAPMKQLLGHESAETAYTVDDYPYGYTLRTKIRYWIETTKTKSGGQRFVSQTLNPKTNRWNTPKRSTYDLVTVLFLDPENGHVKTTGLSKWIPKDATGLDAFIERWQLDDYQTDAIKKHKALTIAMSKVTFTCEISSYGPVSLLSQKPEDIEKRKAIAEKQDELQKNNNRVLNIVTKDAESIYKSLK